MFINYMFMNRFDYIFAGLAIMWPMVGMLASWAAIKEEPFMLVTFFYSGSMAFFISFFEFSHKIPFLYLQIFFTCLWFVIFFIPKNMKTKLYKLVAWGFVNTYSFLQAAVAGLIVLGGIA